MHGDDFDENARSHLLKEHWNEFRSIGTSFPYSRNKFPFRGAISLLKEQVSLFDQGLSSWMPKTDLSEAEGRLFGGIWEQSPPGFGRVWGRSKPLSSGAHWPRGPGGPQVALGGEPGPLL